MKSLLRKPAPQKGPAKRRSQVDPNAAPFSSFLERDQDRQKRQRSRQRTIVISVGLHVAVFAAVIGYSVFQVDELFSPSVEVKVMRASQLPKGVLPPPPAVPPVDPALVIPGEGPPAKR